MPDSSRFEVDCECEMRNRRTNRNYSLHAIDHNLIIDSALAMDVVETSKDG